jgi:topoisomerase-4 subunit A
MAHLEALMQRHFLDYASYFILDRAIPDIRDGLKPVQRRLLYTLYQIDDGRYHKVASVIGETMKLHPHGDAAIGDALVVLANKDYFIDRQGNFGDIITGHAAAAARYIECRLTPLARETLFSDALTELVPSYDGRSKEPTYLPSKLPVALMLGTEGIAVGLSTRILPHNLVELWKAQIEMLRGRRVTLVPDFPQGGTIDASAYDDGRGKVEVRARIEARGDHCVVIREIPYGTTTESLIASIEREIQRGRVKATTIHDFTADKVEIELPLARGARPSEVIPQLYAYTDCSVSHSSNLIVIRGRRPVEMTVSEVLAVLTDDLRERLRLELSHQRGQLEDRRHWLTLEQIFVEERVYRGIEDAAREDAVRAAVVAGMQPFARRFVRPLEDDDVTRLLDLRIRRISAYDIERNRREIQKTIDRIVEIDTKLADMKRTAIAYIKDLIRRYGGQYPRRTKIDQLQAIDVRAVATARLKVSYDPESGYFGTDVKGDLFKHQMSEFDLVLAISQDGSYRVLPPVEKVLIESKLLYCEPFDTEQGCELFVVYRDGKKLAYAKRVAIRSFVRSREYELIKDRAGTIDLLLSPTQVGRLTLHYFPTPRQRMGAATFDLDTLAPTSVGARGTRVAAKPVRKLELSGRRPRREAPPTEPALPSTKRAKRPAADAAAESEAAPPAPRASHGRIAAKTASSKAASSKAGSRKASVRKAATRKATGRKRPRK